MALSNDVYRYIWDGHLLSQGLNPYAQSVQSPLLDAYATPLRARVDFPWMATPYLPAAQAYFAIVESILPQNPLAFRLGASALYLATGWLLLLTLRQLRLPEKAVLVYLWNPLVMVEYAVGAHVDALMVLCLLLAIWGLVNQKPSGRTLSALALSASALVKGWPILAAPLFLRRWGPGRTVLFGISLLLPLALFAAGAGWGLVGPLDGRGVFGALRIYAASWTFNSGLFTWVEKLSGSATARMLAVLVPASASLLLAWLDWRLARVEREGSAGSRDVTLANRRLVRWIAIPFGLYLLLAPTIYPWYLTVVLALLPFLWAGVGEAALCQRWIWPWVYFMFLEAFTYLAYAGLSAPRSLPFIQLAVYLPFWLLLLWAARPGLPNLLDLSRFFRRIREEDHLP
jgi:alpha-1,6-mannosyltransferase